MHSRRGVAFASGAWLMVAPCRSPAIQSPDDWSRRRRCRNHPVKRRRRTPRRRHQAPGEVRQGYQARHVDDPPHEEMEPLPERESVLRGAASCATMIRVAAAALPITSFMWPTFEQLAAAIKDRDESAAARDAAGVRPAVSKCRDLHARRSEFSTRQGRDQGRVPGSAGPVTRVATGGSTGSTSAVAPTGSRVVKHRPRDLYAFSPSRASIVFAAPLRRSFLRIPVSWFDPDTTGRPAARSIASAPTGGCATVTDAAHPQDHRHRAGCFASDEDDDDGVGGGFRPPPTTAADGALVKILLNVETSSSLDFCICVISTSLSFWASARRVRRF